MKSSTFPPNIPPSFPRAGVDPIIDETSAFGVVATQIHRPLRYETVCMVLDQYYRGLAFLIVTDTTDPDDVVEVVAHLAERPGGRVGAIAIATVRPDADRLDILDDHRWLEIDQLAAEQSVELLDWWVIGTQVMQPRTWLGEPSRWPADR